MSPITLQRLMSMVDELLTGPIFGKGGLEHTRKMLAGEKKKYHKLKEFLGYTQNRGFDHHDAGALAKARERGEMPLEIQRIVEDWASRTADQYTQYGPIYSLKNASWDALEKIPMPKGQYIQAGGISKHFPIQDIRRLMRETKPGPHTNDLTDMWPVLMELLGKGRG